MATAPMPTVADCVYLSQSFCDLIVCFSSSLPLSPPLPPLPPPPPSRLQQWQVEKRCRPAPSRPSPRRTISYRVDCDNSSALSFAMWTFPIFAIPLTATTHSHSVSFDFMTGRGGGGTRTPQRHREGCLWCSDVGVM